MKAGQEQLGPMPDDEVKRLIEAGTVHATDHCWCAEMEGWKPLGEVRAFFPEPHFVPPPFSDEPHETPAASASQEGAARGAQPREILDSVWGMLKRGKESAERGVKVTKLKFEAGNRRKERERVCAQLGAEVYAQRDAIPLPATLQGLLESIAQCDQDIAALQQQISEIELSGQTPAPPESE
jgi:hypothetical protein